MPTFTPAEISAMPLLMARLRAQGTVRFREPRQAAPPVKREPDDPLVKRMQLLRKQGHTYRQIRQLTGYSIAHICGLLTRWDQERVDRRVNEMLAKPAS